MSLTAAPYSSLSSLPPLSPILSMSVAKRRTLAASSALATLQSVPIHLDLLVDPSSASTPFFGLFVSHVTPDSTCWDGGLRRGDVILEIARRRTLVVADVAEALKGLIAGDVVSFVVERAGVERELHVMIAARGIDKEEVRTLYKALAEEIAAHDGKPLSSVVPSAACLSLSDILACPAYAASLLSYMQSTLCDECLLFLRAESAYQRIPPTEPLRLRAAAHALYDTFIDGDAPRMVNIKGEGKRAVGERIAVSAITQLMFHAVAREVYGVVEADVLPRYFQSPHFAALVAALDTPQTLAALCSSTMGLPRRRSNSFSAPPCEERRCELEDIRSAFLASSPSPLSLHKRGIGRRPYSGFQGRHLVAWLLREGVVEWAAAAWSVGQRLLDSLLMWRGDDSGGSAAHAGSSEGEDERRRTVFAGDETVYTFAVPDVEAVSRDEDEAAAGGGAGYVLLKGGVAYTRFWLHCHRRRRRLSLYRDQHSTDALYRACLKNATLAVYGLPSPAADLKRSTRRASVTLSPPSSTQSVQSLSPSASPTPPSRFSSSRAVTPITPPPSPGSSGSSGSDRAVPDFPLSTPPLVAGCYLHLRVRDHHARRRELVLRVDELKDAAAWVQTLAELGCSVKYCTSEAKQ